MSVLLWSDIYANQGSHVIQAARRPVDLDERQADAVAARIELDLRIGYAFTRLQTNSLKLLGGSLQSAVISYGKPVVRTAAARHAYVLYRTLPVSYTRLRSRPIFQSQKLQAGTLLEHKDHAPTR